VAIKVEVVSLRDVIGFHQAAVSAEYKGEQGELLHKLMHTI